MYLPFDEGFWQKVHKTETCWIWTGAIGPLGYGTYRGYAAHRVSYVLEYKHLEKKLFVCHSCDNPSCVRPDHLFVGTASDNGKDCYNKGRSNIDLIRGPGFRLYATTWRNKTIMTINQATAIRNEYKDGARQVALAKKYGISRNVIWKIVHGKAFVVDEL